MTRGIVDETFEVYKVWIRWYTQLYQNRVFIKRFIGKQHRVRKHATSILQMYKAGTSLEVEGESKRLSSSSQLVLLFVENQVNFKKKPSSPNVSVNMEK